MATSSAPGTEPSNLINAGTYVFEPSVLDRIPAATKVSVERDTFQKRMAAAEPIGIHEFLYPLAQAFGVPVGSVGVGRVLRGPDGWEGRWVCLPMRSGSFGEVVSAPLEGSLLLEGEIDLGDVRVLSPHQYLWTTGSLASGMAGFFAGKKRWLQESFYRHLRRRTGILMDGGKPVGGKYSFDAENRKPWKGEPPAPRPPVFDPDGITREVAELIHDRFRDQPGRIELTVHAPGYATWREEPRELGVGVHRFDMDENYAYISTEMEGYVGNILVIYDLADPVRPAEVSRWHMPGQHLAGGRGLPVADEQDRRERRRSLRGGLLRRALRGCGGLFRCGHGVGPTYCRGS